MFNYHYSRDICACFTRDKFVVLSFGGWHNVTLCAKFQKLATIWAFQTKLRNLGQHSMQEILRSANKLVKKGKKNKYSLTILLRPKFSFLADSSDSHDHVQILLDSFVWLTHPNPDSILIWSDSLTYRSLSNLTHSLLMLTQQLTDTYSARLLMIH